VELYFLDYISIISQNDDSRKIRARFAQENLKNEEDLLYGMFGVAEIFEILKFGLFFLVLKFTLI